ncbi:MULTISPECIES: preprotein translocase subunit SecG [Flavobacterium]|uniref:preprotein translocase subunit SecG n=1 Tax=Flavobacterium TaxID=237 RepID=UPI001FCBF2D0|nr:MULTISPECIES: preprotein translocase subunit SecG [Flavobacterium]UOK42683.1 preprotein translocase subunit SecG [Flavobacterium enshiense]
MFSIFLVLITIVCFLLVVVVMVQNPKGGGLSSSIGGSQMIGGVQKTNDFLDKSTWTLAGLLIALILLSSLSFTGNLGDNASKIIDNSATAPAATPAPAAPATPEAAKQETAPAATDAAQPAAATEEATK